jgi:hypothetical protein
MEMTILMIGIIFLILSGFIIVTLLYVIKYVNRLTINAHNYLVGNHEQNTIYDVTQIEYIAYYNDVKKSEIGFKSGNKILLDYELNKNFIRHLKNSIMEYKSGHQYPFGKIDE